jgi:DNA-binding transcriptional LysR family regulator
MNLRFLRTLVAIAEHPSFVSAAKAMNLSHSTVSLQIKSLEDELGIALVDRASRTPVLTDEGLALVDYAHQILALADEIKGIGHQKTLSGRVTIGVVPSALSGLIPPALGRLRKLHPKLQVGVRSGLSGELAQAVRAREIDLAVVTAPKVLIDGLISQPICDEPLDVIMPSTITAETDREALAHPFIWFNRKAWAGQLIEEQLASRRILVRPVMEIDSIEAIEALVAHGLGVSITPRRVLSAQDDPQLRRLPFGQPPLFRTLSMISLERSAKRRFADSLLAEMKRLTGQA